MAAKKTRFFRFLKNLNIFNIPNFSLLRLLLFVQFYTDHN